MNNMNSRAPFYGQDGLLDHGQGTDVRDELQTGRVFSMKITTVGAASNKTIAICPAYFDTLGAITKKEAIVSAILADGEIYNNGSGSTITCSALDERDTIDDFIAYIKNNPLTITEINIESSKSDAFLGKIISKEMTPFTEASNRIIHMSNFIQEKDFHKDRKRMVLAKTGDTLFLNTETLVTLDLPADAVITFNFKIGPVLSASKYLEKAYKVAKRNIRATHKLV